MTPESKDFVDEITDLALDVVAGRKNLVYAHRIGSKRIKVDKSFQLSMLFEINQKVQEFRVAEPDLAVALSRLNFQLAKVAKDHATIGVSAWTCGSLAKNAEEFEQALRLFKKARLHLQKVNIISNVVTLTLHIAHIYQKTGEFKKARRQLSRALNKLQEIDSTRQKSELYYMIGLQFEIFETLEDVYKSVAYCKKGLKLSESVRDLASCFKIAENLLRLHYQLDELTDAIAFCSKVISFSRALGDPVSEALYTRQLGLLYHRMSDNNQAVHYFKKSRNLAQKLGNRDLQLKADLGIAVVLAAASQYSASFSLYKKLLHSARDLQDDDFELALLSSISSSYLRIGRPAKALHYERKAQRLAAKLNKTKVRIHSLVKIAEAEIDCGFPHRAINRLQKELLNHQKSMDPGVGYRLNGVLARAHLESGHPELAQDFFSRAIPFARQLHKVAPLSVLLMNYGSACQYGHRIQQALEAYEEAIGLTKKHHDRQGEAKIQSYVGDLYYFYGDIIKAREAYGSSLKLFRSANDRSGILMNLMQIARVSKETSMIDEARLSYEKLMQIAQRWRFPKYEIQAAGNLGVLLCAKSEQYELKNGLYYLNKAINIAHKHKFVGAEMQWKNELGSIHSALGSLTQASAIFKSVLAVAKKTGDVEAEMQASVGAATICKRTAKYRNGYQFIKRAVSICEKLREQAHLERHKIKFMEASEKIYSLAVEICIAMDEKKTALRFLEMAKSRALADQVSLQVMRLYQSSRRTRDLIAKEKTILLKLKSMQELDIFNLNQALLDSERPVLKYKTLTAELENVYTKLGEFDHQYVALRKGLRVSYTAIRSALCR